MSLAPLIDSSNKVFEIDKDIISFKINSNSCDSSSELIPIGEEEISITNLTQDYLAFRAKTTKSSNYAVNPSHFILSPNEIKKIKIIVYNVSGETDTKDHKFKFEGFAIIENEKDKDVKELFYKYIKKGNKIKGNIIKRNVKYIYEKEKENETNKEKEKKENIQEEKVENLKKEEIQSKRNNQNQNINNDNEHKNNSDNKKKKISHELDINKDMNKYLFIGLFLISLITIYFLFK